MRAILQRSNVDLLREVTQLQELLQQGSDVCPPELDQYREWAIATCGEFHYPLPCLIRVCATVPPLSKPTRDVVSV